MQPKYRNHIIPSLRHGQDFEEALAACIERFEIIETLETQLAYPACVVDFYGDQLPAMHELERYVRSPWHNVPLPVQTPPPMANVAWALLDYQDRDAEIQDFLAGVAASCPGVLVRPDEAPEVGEAIKELLAERYKLLEFASVINFQKRLPVLEMEARCDRDQGAMIRLAQVDKTAIYAGWFRQVVIQRQYAGDWAFFASLGKALAKPVVNGTARWHKAVIIAGYFWDEYFALDEWPVNRIFNLFKTKGILARQDKLAAFRFRLNRAGLKKPLHNRK